MTYNVFSGTLNPTHSLIISNENTILAALSETANIRNVCSVYYSEQWSSH